MLERKGTKVNLKKGYPLFREEGLAVRRRRGRRQPTGMRVSKKFKQLRRMIENKDQVGNIVSDAIEHFLALRAQLPNLDMHPS